MIRAHDAGLPLIEAAPAKINLTLAVKGRRADGYHELESLVVFAGADASDTVELAEGASFHLEILGPGAALLADEGSNLVARAVTAVMRAAPQAATGTFRLHKHLPVAAGIGGGSADAAAALRLLRRANPDLAASIDWPRVAATIGADVRVCLECRVSAMWGIGEHVVPLPQLPPVWAVMANPGVPLSTADVFRALSAPPLPVAWDASAAPRIPHFGALADLIGFVQATANDLEAPALALCPAVAELKTLLAGLDGALLSRMSGSGPTCFALFATAEAAAEGARWLASHRPSWWVRATPLH